MFNTEPYDFAFSIESFCYYFFITAAAAITTTTTYYYYSYSYFGASGEKLGVIIEIDRLLLPRSGIATNLDATKRVQGQLLDWDIGWGGNEAKEITAGAWECLDGKDL